MKQSPPKDSGQEKGPGLVDQSNDPSNEFPSSNFTPNLGLKASKVRLEDARFPLAKYAGFYETIPRSRGEFTFDQVEQYVLHAGSPFPTENKHNGPYFTGPMKSAPLKGKTLEKAIAAGRTGDALIGVMRSATHSLGGAVYKFDLDDIPTADFARVVEKLKAQGIAYILYTTFKHGVKEGLVRARLLLFGDRLADPEEFERVSRFVGLELLDCTYDASEHLAYQLAGVWVCPESRKKKAWSKVSRGWLIDTDAALAVAPPLKGRAANDGPNSTRGSNSLDTPPKRAAYVDSDDWELGPIPDYIKARVADTTRELMNSALGGVDGDWEGSLDELKSALWAISPDDQEVWSAVAFDLYPLGEIGLGLFLKWSEECDRAGKWDRDAAVEKWNDKACTWSPEEGTGRAKVIFKKARENGWVSPGADRHGGITDPNFIGGEPEPEELTLVEFPAPYPGFMANTVAAVLQAAHKPQPRLTTLAVLVGMASACDGRVSLPDGGRLNLYALGIAETAGGKDAPRSAAEDIARAVGAKTIGGLASGQGLEDALPEAGAAFMGVDEIGHDLRNISQGKAPTHLVEAHKVLLKLYTVSNGVYQTREKAATKGNPKSRMLTNPCLNVLGFTTPSTLSSALSTESIESGLLGRFLFAVGDLDVRQRLSLKEREIDKTMMSALTELNRNSRPGRRRIMISEDIEASLQKMVDRIHDEQVATEDPIGRSLLGRTFEKVMRVAGILAFWDSIPTPKDETVNEILSKVVDEDGPAPADIGMRQAHLDWAERLVRASNAALLQFAKDRIHDDEIQANAAKITRLVNGIVSGKYKAANTRHRGLIKKKLAPRQLCLNRARLNATQFDIALKHAEAAGMLVSGELKEEGERLPIAWLAIPQDD